MKNKLIWNGEIVITSKYLAEICECKSISVNSKRAKYLGVEFIEGEHYYKLKGEELKQFKESVENLESFGIGKQASSLILWNKYGALENCKQIFYIKNKNVPCGDYLPSSLAKINEYFNLGNIVIRVS